MRLRPATSPALPAAPARVPRRLLALGLLGAVGFALVTAGVVRLPDLEGVLTDLSDTLGPWTYALVAALAFLETGAFVGLVAPGETVVIAGGVIAGQGEIKLIPLIGLVWICATLGDTTSFYIGRRLGRRFLERHGPKVKITHERLEQVERYFNRYGGRTILIGRFIGLVRALAPFVAG
jgi:membrane protein DedA with SNARE-associated domain